MIRYRVLPVLLVLASLLIAAVDAFVLSSVFMPAVVYVLPVLLAAYFLPSPRAVAAIYAWTVALQISAYLFHGEGLTLLPTSYVLGLSLMSALSVVLSDRVRREAGLRARLESILRQLPAGVLIVDANTGKTLLANKQMEQLVGLESGPLGPYADFNRLSVLRRDGRPYKLDELPLVRSIDSGEQVSSEEALLMRPDGSRITVAATSAPIRDEQGRTAAAVLILTDVTEQKRAEDERERLYASEQEARSRAEKAVKARDEFISIAAHELKTPVTSLRGFAQLTTRNYHKTGSLDPERSAQVMERINQQSLRLTNLVDQLLSLSRLQAGKLMLSPEEQDLKALVMAAVDMSQTLHPTRTFLVDHVEETRAIVDGLRIEQVFTNLLENAVKFSPKDSVVEVSLGLSELGWAEVAVRDHGSGVPEEARESIFDRYVQAHGERNTGGMGLGLYISREIVEMHGGSLRCEDAPEGGSRFVVRLPVSQDRALV